MMNSLSIKTKLLCLALLTLLTLAVTGTHSYLTIESLSDAMSKIVLNSTILRNQMLGDMYHDSLNSDVNAALLATENRSTKANEESTVDDIEKELEEHSRLFNEALNKNEKLIVDKKAREALEKTLPDLRNYIASATRIVQLAKTDRPAAIAMMPNFHAAFKALEVSMERLTQLIEDDVEATQAEADQTKSMAIIVLAIVIAIGLVITIIISMLIISTINSAIAKLVLVSERVADGDLTVVVDTSSQDELGHFARSMEKMRINLMILISQLNDTSEKLLLSVEEISGVTKGTNANMSNQHLDTEQVATAMNQMTATVHEVANNILVTASSAQQAAEETNMGGLIVEDTVQSITVLSNQISQASEIINRVEYNSHNISSVLDVIRNIAEQTNLLALNAAIEAARAGEQGRGFAVVADEVRTLASRTQQSTGEINEMISELQAESKSSVEAMNKSCEQANLVAQKAAKAGNSLAMIANTVSKISELSAQIATAAEEQTSVSEEINRNIVHINDVATITSSSTQKTTDAVNRLEKITIDMQRLVQKFKV